MAFSGIFSCTHLNAWFLKTTLQNYYSANRNVGVLYTDLYNTTNLLAVRGRHVAEVVMWQYG